MYQVKVDWAPAYELLSSMHAYLGRADRKIMDLGASWAKSVQQQLRPDIAAELAIYKDASPAHAAELLVWLCPEERDAAGFVYWVGALSPGELYEYLAPYVLDKHAPLLRNLPAQISTLARLLTAWEEQYFRGLNPAILDGLAAGAAAKRALVKTMAPRELVELATGGIDYRPAPDVETVLLVPQYHYRPWNVYALYRGLKVYLYPVDAVTPAPGTPTPGLLRLTRTLADESRLRILRFLADGPRTFTDVVGFTGLAKGTVHHHMVALRAAGLVRVHESDDGTVSYSLRPRALDDLGQRLGEYLKRDS